MDPKHMSERQQTLYLLNMTRSDSAKSDTRNTDADIEDLQAWIDELKLKERKPNLRKQVERQALFEEACLGFRLTKRSNYLERKAVRVSANDSMVCNCRPPYLLTEGQYLGHYTRGCGRNCLNRLLCTECFTESCPAKELCTNRVFQQQLHCNVYPIKTEKCGWGLAAGQVIPKGSFIIQYVGEIFNVDSEIGQKRIEKYRGSHCVYLMSTSQNEVIDPTTRGNLARFINHCCDPNCETQKWNVLGEICIGIFAKRDIAEDEELTFDYRFDAHKTAFTKCLCGAARCRKYLGYIGSEVKVERSRRSLIECDECKETDRLHDLVKCYECSRTFHQNCIIPPLKKRPKLGWMCNTCKPISVNCLREWSTVVTRRTLEHVRRNLEEVIGTDTKIVWEKNAGEEAFKVTLRGNDVARAKEKVESIRIEDIAERETCGAEVGEVELKVPVCFLRQLAGPDGRALAQYTNEQLVVITFDEELLDKPYSLDECTSLILTGYRSSLDAVAVDILERLDNLTLLEFDLLAAEVECCADLLILPRFPPRSCPQCLQQPVNPSPSVPRPSESSSLPSQPLTDCKHNKDPRVSELKRALNPVELHFSNKFFTIAPSSPLGFGSAKLCKGRIIGHKDAVKPAFSQLKEFLHQVQGAQRKTSHTMIIDSDLQIKAEALTHRIVQSSLYPTPLQVRIEGSLAKSSSSCIHLSGTWKQCVASVKRFSEELYGPAGLLTYNEHRSLKERQLIRYMLKHAAHYLYYRFFKEEAVLPVLKYWDLQTFAILNPVKTEPQLKLLRTLLEHRGVLFYYLNLADTKAAEACLGDNKAALERIVNDLEAFSVYFRSCSVDTEETPIYDSAALNEFVELYFNDDDTFAFDNRDIIDSAIKEVRSESDFHLYSVWPLSYRVNLMSDQQLVSSKLKSVLNSIESLRN